MQRLQTRREERRIPGIEGWNPVEPSSPGNRFSFLMNLPGDLPSPAILTEAGSERLPDESGESSRQKMNGSAFSMRYLVSYSKFPIFPLKNRLIRTRIVTRSNFVFHNLLINNNLQFVFHRLITGRSLVRVQVGPFLKTPTKPAKQSIVPNKNRGNQRSSRITPASAFFPKFP
jgi:hypothetical protein